MQLLEEQNPLFVNFDDEDRKLQRGDSRYNLNIESGIHNEASTGTITNCRGNTKIPFPIPAGNNRSIGTCNVPEEGYIFFFLKNSLNNHSIWRLSTDTDTVELVGQTPLLAFDKRINHSNYVDGLLYWVDGGVPRKINTIKALENKARKANIYFFKNTPPGGTILNGIWEYQLTTTDPSGNVISFGQIRPPGNFDAKGITSSIVNAISSAAPYTVTGIDYVEVTMKNLGDYNLTIKVLDTNTGLFVENAAMVVAQNYYPKEYLEDFFVRAKSPFACDPHAEYLFDGTTKVNLVQNQVFQFATQYVYDDYEYTTLSPISIIPLSMSSCGSSSGGANFVRIHFTEDRLNTPEFRSIIRRVRVLFREHNEGLWKEIVSLEQFEMKMGDNYYDFYNNGNYRTLSRDESDVLFSATPIYSKCQEFVGGRLFDNNITEGYDTIPVNTVLKINLNEPLKDTFSIKGRVYIQNTETPGAFYQPIHDTHGINTDSYTTSPDPDHTHWSFGGVNTLSAPAPANWLNNHVKDMYRQYIYLGGFVVYLAGTDRMAVSRQPNRDATIQDFNTGIYQTDTFAKLQKLVLLCTKDKMYSEYEITGVRPGQYVLRVASHLTKKADIDSGLSYQKSSTYIKQVAGASFNNPHEVRIEVLSNGDILNITTGALYPVGTSIEDIFIEDLSSKSVGNDPVTNSYYWGVGGYVTDFKGNALPATFAEAILEQRIDQARVEILTVANLVPIVESVYADHNGFFFYRGPLFGGGTIERVVKIFSGNYQGICTQYDYFTFPALAPTPIPLIAGINYVFARNSDIVLTNYSSTIIKGFVRDSAGNPIANIPVVVTHGDFTHTDSNGEYNIIVYRDSRYAVKRKDTIVFTQGNCRMIFAPPVWDFDINIFANPLVLHYNLFEPYIVPQDIIGTILAGIASNAFKRGFDGEFGIVYYDEINRSTTVCRNDGVKLHIPFYTEKDSSGIIGPKGLPTVTWEVRHYPPSWATHWQWVRTRNLQLNYWLQFVANKVEYVDKAISGVVVGYNDALLAKINISNLVTYNEKNPGSLVGYSFSEGDRIRFIADANGNYFPDYYDAEIRAFDSVGQDIYVDKNFSIGQLAEGVLFEIYSPRRVGQQKLFYEFGECFPVIKDGVNSYHGGLTQNQTATGAATGTFRSGDAYYRERTMPFTDHGTLLTRDVTRIIDDPSISDFYLSNDDMIGRINIENPDSGRLYREKTFRFSNEFIRDTKINGLSWFGALNSKDIDRTNGPVNRIIRSNNILLAIQPTQSSSVYINEIIYLDAKGNTSLTLSDKVIGNIRTLLGEYGTVNPESFSQKEGRTFWFDRMSGAHIQYYNDGMIPVSNYKMISYFHNKARQVVDKEVIGGYDSQFAKPLLTFPDETIGFNELENRYPGFYSYLPDAYAYVGQKFYGWKDGELWLFNENAKHNNFFGVQYSSIVTPVFNQNSGAVRQFQAISEETTEAWHAPRVSVPPTAQYPQGMLSLVRLEWFKVVEGVQYAALKRDLNTPNAASLDEALINGDKLRGHILEVRLQNDSQEFVKLNAVNCKYVLSEMSKK